MDSPPKYLLNVFKSLTPIKTFVCSIKTEYIFFPDKRISILWHCRFYCNFLPRQGEGDNFNVLASVIYFLNSSQYWARLLKTFYSLLTKYSFLNLITFWYIIYVLHTWKFIDYLASNSSIIINKQTIFCDRQGNRQTDNKICS